MTTAQKNFRVRPLAADQLGEVRRTGRDVRGNPAVRQVARGGEPLRCCLRDARAGEELILFGYRPPIAGESPYVEVGPVFAHAADCPGPAATDSYPADWLGRAQVLRAYDERGWIADASVAHDGGDPAAAIAAVLADPAVTQIHSRNIVYGCFMMVITRD
ncbi:MAG TPA: DUF1203 domain-containing protein [Pseudonocardiaceae bacterium]|jgi:hypothetical protein|nr:DUF1203 domain-containing protein [Pseudonocardiaceae bacterium]